MIRRPEHSRVSRPLPPSMLREKRRSRESLRSGINTPSFGSYKTLCNQLTRGRPRAKGVEMSIDTGQAHPLRQRAYRLSQRGNEHIAKEVQSLLDQGLIFSTSYSPWASPVVLAPKADGSLRFCVNYGKLDALATDSEPAYPLPRIDEVLEHLGQGEVLQHVRHPEWILTCANGRGQLRQNCLCDTAGPF